MRRVVLLSMLVLLLGGCALNAAITRGRLNNLRIGMTKQEVIQTMGSPIQVEAYQFQPGVQTEFLFYRTDYHLDMAGEPHETLVPVAIENGLVQGWGRNYYDNRIKVQNEVIIHQGKQNNS